MTAAATVGARADPSLPDPARDAAPQHGLEPDVELRAAALARGSGALRRALAAVAGRLVAQRSWERLGFARLGDYAGERLGLSAREVQDLARTDAALASLPGIEAALVAGTISWTKARLLGRVAEPDDETRWLAFARRVSAGELAREVRAVDRGALESGGVSPADVGEDDDARSVGVAIRCTPQVVVAWNLAWRLAQRVSGAALPRWACAEAIAAEVASAIPVDLDAADMDDLEPVTSESDPADQTERALAAPPPGRPIVEERAARRRRGAQQRAGPPATHCELPALPSPGRELLHDLESADAFELDRRLALAVSLEQRREAELGRALLAVASRRLYRARGYRSFEAYVRDRLGLPASKGWALLRLERAPARLVRAAYCEGRLSWLQAHALVSLLLSLGRLAAKHEAAWVAWAQRVTLRRLRDDVDRAREQAQCDPHAFATSGGLPQAGNGGGLRIGARDKGAETPPLTPEAAAETAKFFFRAPIGVAHLFRAVVCTARRRLAAQLGRLPSEGEACAAIFDHVFDAWGARHRVRRAHRVFARDGWRCTAPGCSSMRNLHDHHIVYRSHRGSNELSNRTTLCAWHHLRGEHAKILRCSGRAPDALRFELGLRPGRAPWRVYYSGDVVSPTRQRYQEATLR